MKRVVLVVLLLILFAVPPAAAAPEAAPDAPRNATYQSLPFSQNWGDISLVTANDNWSNVPGIVGYLGDYDANSPPPTGVDPQTLLLDYASVAIDVIANQTTPNTLTTGGVAEFQITDPVVALQGSGTADAPFLLFYVNTTGYSSIQVAYNLRDIDGAADNAVQPVALHYRVGASGNFTNIPSAYIADATTGPSLATLVTPFNVTLPAAADNQAQVQLRIMTTNAVGSDEWVGIDDISITGTPIAGDTPPTVTTTVPAGLATNVAVNSTVTLKFSESVDLTAAAVTVECPVGTGVTFSGLPADDTSSVVLTPSANLPYNATCTVTAVAAKITDNGTPANPLDGDKNGTGGDNYVFTFTTVADIPPTVISTVPANGAPDVAVNADIEVTFSEPVTIANIDSFFDIFCQVSGVSTSQPGTGSGGPTTFTINPTADLPAGSLCAVKIKKAEVVDQDGTPDAMAADHDFTFTTAAANICGDSADLIHDIQGNGTTSSVAGQVKTIEGVVVGDFQVTGTEFGGFFVQEEDADADTADTTSEGIFVYDNGFGVAVAPGDKVRVRGTVSEWISGGTTLTQLGAITSVVVCKSGLDVTAAAVILPAASATAFEAYEGMKVVFAQELTVTGNYTLGRYGELDLSSGGRLWQPTNVVDPGPVAVALQATNDLRRIVLDDSSNVQNPATIRYPEAAGLGNANTLRTDDTVTGMTGVMDQRFGKYRIQPTGPVNFMRVNNRPAAPAAVGGTLKVASFNLLNYFSTVDTTASDSSGSCGPSGTMDCRGADSTAEFTRQRNKTISAITTLGPDVLGVMELENNATVAVKDLVDGLNASAGAGTYAYIDTGVRGTDAIRVALIYKPGSVMPAGAFMIDNDAIFDRPPLAQTFQVATTGEKFSVVVNHFKSKSCGSAAGLDADQGDGQGCYNNRRMQQATKLLTFINTTIIPASGDGDVLIIGDLNSYAKEDPITVLSNGGFTNLKADPAAYSYSFSGQSGYLDHALANASLAAQVTGITDWHINADEPPDFDYNDAVADAGESNAGAEYNQPGLYAANPFRTSDHDPVLVGLDLMQNDWSDLAAPYSAAWHTPSALILGEIWAAGHAATVGAGSNDGVSVVSAADWSPTNGGQVEVTVNGAAGYVTGWIDWDKNSAFDDPAERIFVNEVFTAGETRTISFAIPDGVTISPNSFNARFRVYPTAQTALALAAAAPDAAPSPGGGATGGEAEDYAWAFSTTAVTLRSFTAMGASGAGWPAAAGLGALGIVLLAWRRRK